MKSPLERLKSLENSLEQSLETISASPPLGFGKFVSSLKQSFQMFQILGYQSRVQNERIAKLEQQIKALTNVSEDMSHE